MLISELVTDVWLILVQAEAFTYFRQACIDKLNCSFLHCRSDHQALRLLNSADLLAATDSSSRLSQGDALSCRLQTHCVV